MIYFVSDVHLGFFERDKDKIIENKFLSLLGKIKSDCSTLVLLGDIFDFWFEYKRVIPSYFYRTLAVLGDLVASGIKIDYIMGNHDFGHNTFFKNELGIDIIDADLEREFFGKKFYLTHGDAKGYKDTGYLILKRILRNKKCQKLFSLLHPDCGIGFALMSSRSSRKHTTSKDYGERDGMFEFAKDRIAEGFDYVVMGHRHLAEVKIFRLGDRVGEYINLGSWLDEPHFGKFDGEQFSLVKF